MIGIRRIITGWIPSSLCALIIAYASLYPYGEFGLMLDVRDWIQHGIAYMVLSFTLSFPVKSGFARMPLQHRILSIIAICVAFGILMELGQFISPGRTPSIIDASANLIGALIGQILFVYTRFMD